MPFARLPFPVKKPHVVAAHCDMVQPGRVGLSAVALANWGTALFEWLVEVGHRGTVWLGTRLPLWLRRFLYIFGLVVSPAIALSDEERRRERSMIYSTAALIPVVWFFSLGLNVIFTASAGRLLPDNNITTVNFLEDTNNLILYAFLCPMYISLSIQIILVSSRYGTGIRDRSRPKSVVETIRSPIAVCLCVAAAAALIANYMSDVAVGGGGFTFWFNDRVGGVRVLNGPGVYYCLMTFGFLSTLLFATLNYVSIATASLRLAGNVTAEDCSDLAAMRDAFRRFSEANAYARCLIAVLMIHTLIWSRSELADTLNIHLAGGALVLGAFFATAIPARHLNDKVRIAAESCGRTLDELEIIPIEAAPWVRWADRIIASCYLLLWGWEPIVDLLNTSLGQSRIQ